MPGHFRRRQGLAEQIPLHLIATPGPQKVELRMCLHPLGNDDQAQAMRHDNDGLHDGRIVRIMGKIRHKGLVNLQIVEREVLEIAERRQAPSEIIAGGHVEADVRRVVRLIDGAEYKRRQAAPGLKITTKAFGVGRRIPVAQRWREI